MAGLFVLPIYNDNHPRRKHYHVRKSPLRDMTDNDFFARYRYTKNNFRRLLDLGLFGED